MKIYNAHPITREYTGDGHADADPLSPGDWLVPAHAYTDAPPAPKVGFVARRSLDSGAWELVEDMRGTLIYSTETGNESELGSLGPVPNGYTTLRRPSELHAWNGTSWVIAANLQAEVIATRRYAAEISGITYAGMRIETDDRSKLLINGAALEAMLDPHYVTQWKSAGTFFELNATQVLAIARAVRAHVQACFNREAELLEALGKGSLEPTAIEQGWPS